MQKLFSKLHSSQFQIKFCIQNWLFKFGLDILDFFEKPQFKNPFFNSSKHKKKITGFNQWQKVKFNKLFLNCIYISQKMFVFHNLTYFMKENHRTKYFQIAAKISNHFLLLAFLTDLLRLKFKFCENYKVYLSVI